MSASSRRRVRKSHRGPWLWIVGLAALAVIVFAGARVQANTPTPPINGIGIGTPWLIQQSSEGPFVASGTCFRWLHTHTDDGVIHIESPVQRTFSLAEFFAIWGEPLNANQVAGAEGRVVAYVNGERWSGDLHDITLQAHDLIQLDVGDDTPPQPFTFPAGL